MKRIPLAALAALLPLAALADDTEDALRQQLVGKWVDVRIDLPATHKGVDLEFHKPSPFDASENADRLGSYGLALRAGSRARVSHIKLKKDMIEFHLDGGGFNWGSDTTTRTFSSSPKTSRENELDREIKKETDQDRKRRLERERDEYRRDREREDDRRKRDLEEWNQVARENDRRIALGRGSRINLRYKGRVPPAVLSAEGLEEALASWIDFHPPAGGAVGRPDDSSNDDREDVEDQVRLPLDDGPLGFLQKGLSRRSLEGRLGRAEREDRSDYRGLDVRVATYRAQAGKVVVTFVNDVVVAFEEP